MVAAESTFEIPVNEEIYLVSQRKYNLDPSRPWWQKVFFRCVFLPFLRFSFHRVKIGAPGAIEPCGQCNPCIVGGTCANPYIVIIEQQCVCTDPQHAEDACTGEFYSWKPLPLNTALPDESVQYKGQRNPLSVLPDRYRRRTFPLTVTPDQHLQEVKRNLEQTIKSLAAT